MNTTTKKKEKKLFWIEGGLVVYGYSYGDNWNGWACPFFDRDTAELILMEVCDNTSEWDYRFDDITQSFIINDPYYPDDPEVFEKNEDNLWSIGGWSWVWEIIDETDIH